MEGEGRKGCLFGSFSSLSLALSLFLFFSSLLLSEVVACAVLRVDKPPNRVFRAAG